MSQATINKAYPTLVSDFDTPTFNRLDACVECTDYEECTLIEDLPVCARCFEVHYNEDWSRKAPLTQPQINRLAVAVTFICVAVVFFSIGVYATVLFIGVPQ